MSHPDEDTAAPAGLRHLFLLIVIVEVLTIAALYWFGRYFS